MPEATSAKPGRGPIIISRHGRPALDRRAGPRLHWRGYIDWWDRYEQGPLAEGQDAPQTLKDMVADADIVFASARLRAQQTADSAVPHRRATYDPVFNEAPLPPPKLHGLRALPKTWNILAPDIRWMESQYSRPVFGPARPRKSCMAPPRQARSI